MRTFEELSNDVARFKPEAPDMKLHVFTNWTIEELNLYNGALKPASAMFNALNETRLFYCGWLVALNMVAEYLKFIKAILSKKGDDEKPCMDIETWGRNLIMFERFSRHIRTSTLSELSSQMVNLEWIQNAVIGILATIDSDKSAAQLSKLKSLGEEIAQNLDVVVSRVCAIDAKLFKKKQEQRERGRAAYAESIGATAENVIQAERDKEKAIQQVRDKVQRKGMTVKAACEYVCKNFAKGAGLQQANGDDLLPESLERYFRARFDRKGNPKKRRKA